MKLLRKKRLKRHKMIGKTELGSGIYTIPDIGLILGIPLYKIRRYLKKYWDEGIGKKLFNDKYSWEFQNNRKVVNFQVLIEFYIFFEFQQKGVNTKKIVKAREAMAKEFNTPYPFANRKFLTDGNSIWYYLKDDVINADLSKQTNLVGIIESLAEKIEFNGDMAQKIFPLGKEHNVVVSPHNQFGQPVINKTNIVTDTIYSMFKAGEKKETLSMLYDISTEQINDVIEFHSKLKLAA